MTLIRAILLKVAAAFFLIAGAQAAGATTYTGTFGYSGPIKNLWDQSIEDFDFSGTFQITFGQHPVGTILNGLVPDAFALTIGSASFDASNTRVDVFTGLTPAPEVFVFHFWGVPAGGNVSASSPVPDFAFLVHYNTESGAVPFANVVVGRPNGSADGVFLGNSYLTDGGTFSFSISPNPGAVPEPATWLLMIAGLAATGASLRMRAARPAVA